MATSGPRLAASGAPHTIGCGARPPVGCDVRIMCFCIVSPIAGKDEDIEILDGLVKHLARGLTVGKPHTGPCTRMVRPSTSLRVRTEARGIMGRRCCRCDTR